MAEGAARRSTLAWSLLTLIAAAWYLPFSRDAVHAGFVADDALYLMMADWFAHGWRDDPVLLYVQSVSHLPPLYPLLLAAAGGGSEQLDIAHLVQNICLIAAVLVNGLLAARVCDSAAAGLLVAALVVVMPATLLMSTEIWSEFLYLDLCGLALLAALGARRRPALWLAVAACAGLAAVTRGFGIVLVIALVLVTARRAQRWCLPAAVLAAAPLLVSELLGLGGGTGYIEIFQDRVTDVGTALSYLGANLRAIEHGWTGTFAPAAGAGVRVALLAATALALGGFLQRLRGVELDAVYVAGYLALLVIWPFPHVMDRLVYPLAPIVAMYAALTLRQLGEHLQGNWQRPLTLAPPALLLAIAAWHGGHMAWRYLAQTPPPELQAWRASRFWLMAADDASGIADLRRRAAIVALLRDAGERIPPRACVYSNHPQAVMFHTRRIAWPAPPLALRPASPACRFHVVLHREAERGGGELLWPNAEFVLEARAGQGLAALLVHYPR